MPTTTVYELTGSGVVDSVEDIEGRRRVRFAGGESIELEYGGVGEGFCVNAAGEVVSYGSS